jgi:opacity protein-like surface antigen
VRIARAATLAVVATAAAALAVAVAPVPAMAAPSGDTSLTFDVNAGTLDITVPTGPVSLGSGAPGATISGQFPATPLVTVTDDRATSPAAWTVTVTSTPFTNSTGPICTVTAPTPEPAECVITVAAGNLTYNSGTVTKVSGNGTVNGSGGTNPGSTVPVGTGVTGASYAGGTGTDSANWRPTVALTIPLVNVSGTYNGTLTHSVAGA